ncbi:WD repeat-containing protein 91-like [Sycon ciliatum]|uniref:WD repeat-containing protein 91-like n=1 Tax=Sycon ciliatum TaxID=27933 RepID=UPI0031F70F4B
MASGTPGVDELIREYLLFRGFTNTLRAFETEIKNDKDKTFRADRIVEQLQSYIHSFDIVAVRNLWQYLDRRFFSRLEHAYASSVKRLETCLLRYYLVNCCSANRSDRIHDFFERYATELQPHPEWREWFALPFTRNPDQERVFAVYFSRSWLDSVVMSLYNLLSVIFDNMPLPALLQYFDDQRRIHKLSEEVEGLRHELHILHSQQHQHLVDLESQQASAKRAAQRSRLSAPPQQSVETKSTSFSTAGSTTTVTESRDIEASPPATSQVAVSHQPSQATAANLSTAGGAGKAATSADNSTSSSTTVHLPAASTDAATAAGKASGAVSPIAITDDFFKSANANSRAAGSGGNSPTQPAGSTTAKSPLPSHPSLSAQSSRQSHSHTPTRRADSSPALGKSPATPSSVVRALTNFVLPSNTDSTTPVNTTSSGSTTRHTPSAGISSSQSFDSNIAAAVGGASTGSAASTATTAGQRGAQTPEHRVRTHSQPTPSAPTTTPGVFIPGITNSDKPSSATLPRGQSHRSPATSPSGAVSTAAGTGVGVDGMAGSTVTATSSATTGTPTAMVANPLAVQETSAVTQRAYTEEDSPFIFLSEETYIEHRASVTKCRFAPGGSCVASCDIEGVVKVWSPNPCRTVSTVMAKNPVMTIDWMAAGAAASNNNVLLLGYGNGKVRMYDVGTKLNTAEFEASAEYPRVVSLASTYSSSGTVIAVGSAGAATTASLAQEQQAASLVAGAAHSPQHQASARHHRLSLTRLFSSSSSSSSVAVDTGCGQLSLWDALNTTMLMPLTLDPAPTCINTLQFNHQGNLLACGSADGMIRIFDINTGDCLVGWHAHMGQVYSIGFHRDENSLFSLGHDGKFNQWSIRQVAQKINEIPLDTSVIGGLQMAISAGPFTYSPYNSLFRLDDDGDHILTSTANQGSIFQLCDASSSTLSNVLPRKAVTLRGHAAPVVGIDWNTALSCSTCLSSAQDGSIYVSTLLKQ